MKENETMLKNWNLKKKIALLFALGIPLYLSVFINDVAVYAAEEETAMEEVVSIQNNTVEPVDEVPDSEEFYQEDPEPYINEELDQKPSNIVSDTEEAETVPEEPVTEDQEETVSTPEVEDSVVYNSTPIVGGASYQGVIVRVSAPAGSFPEGTTVQISAVTNAENRVGFDITFFDPSGNEVQPANDLGVTLTFSIDNESHLLSQDGKDRKITIYHKNYNGLFEEVLLAITNEKSVQLKIVASHFSEYGVFSEAFTENVANRDQSNTSANLSDFLTGISINAPMDENGNYIVNPNSNYDVTFTFSENESLQFDDNGVLQYDFPDGIIISDIGATSFSLNIVDEQGSATVSDNTYEVVNGQLRVRFNQNDPNFERLIHMPNVTFNILFASSFDETVGEIVFNENIVKDFIYESKSDLEIVKNVRYDQNRDMARYEVQIRSEGLNENVVIEDRLTGTALIFNQDVVVESNKRGVLAVVPDYTSINNGFRLLLDYLMDDEILTLRYTANVDNTKITGTGTVEETNNTARVLSDQVPEGKEDSANFNGQVNFQKVKKEAVGEAAQIGEGLYEQEWRVTVNADHKIPMGGATIHDWIVQSSRPFMQFTGEGVTVLVTFENGTTETRFVSWSELETYSNNFGIYGWSYLTPESDGKASYVISSKTIIDTTNALGSLNLRNGAQINSSHYVESSINIGVVGENELDLQKKAIGTTSTESEWELVATVPGTGLPEFHIVDDAPRLVHEGVAYTDYAIADSFVIDGLLEGETWRLVFTNENRTFVIYFYKSQIQDNANAGLLPTSDGRSRQIRIRYKTAVNQDWLNLAAEDGYVSSTLYRHRNYASAYSGNYRTPTVEDSVIPIKPVLIKDYIGRTEVEIDGVTYPVFNYNLSLSGNVQDGMVIQDLFNTDYLKLYETAGVQIKGGNTQTPTNGNSNGTVSAVETENGIDMIVTAFPKQANGRFYNYYVISYSLIVKSQQALAMLNNAAAASQNGIDLENVAKWNDLESQENANYTYFPYVDKELVSRPTAENGYVAEFTIIINKYAEDLDPASDTLTVQDVLSGNLRFIPDSLTISPNAESISVQHDAQTNTLIFTGVPDQMTFTITYKARVLGGGNVEFSNTVKFGNYEKNITETIVVESSGVGTGSNPSITLVKRDAENITNTLAGATFQLYVMENGTPVPVRDRNGQNVYFTTGSDGKVLIVGNLQRLGWTLWAERTYCLIETAAPVGYEISVEPIYFVLSQSPMTQMEFDITGDQLNVLNESIKRDITVTKTWVGTVGSNSVIVHLLANGEDTGLTITLTEGESWYGTFEGLRKFDEQGNEINYSVQEELIDGFTSQYSGSSEDGYIITNISQETVTVTVSKQWVGPSANEVTIQLLADGIVIDERKINGENGWQTMFENLPKYDSLDGHEIIYSIQEVELEGYVSEISANQNEFIVTNTNVETIDITVQKVWNGKPTQSITVFLFADGVNIATVELNGQNQWQYAFNGLLKYDLTDGHEIIYSIAEAPVSGYETEIYGDVQSGFIITNTEVVTPPPFEEEPPKKTVEEKKTEEKVTEEKKEDPVLASKTVNTGTKNDFRNNMFLLILSVIGLMVILLIKKMPGPRKS